MSPADPPSSADPEDDAPATAGAREVVVVGGAGFLGSHLVDRLLAEGDHVDVIDDLSTGSLGNLADARAVATADGRRLTIHHLDAGTTEATAVLAMRRPEIVYLLAGVPPAASSSEAMGAALTRVLTILDAACQHGVGKVVAVLPAGVLYGSPAVRDLPVKERPIEPRGVRGVLARAVVDLLDLYRSDRALEFTALAVASVFGPRQQPDHGVVAAFLEAARRGLPPEITGDGRQSRDFVYVDDVADALIRAGRRGSGLVINIGTGVQTPIRELWSMVAGTKAPSPRVAPARIGDLGRFAVSPVRARIHLGWSPWTTLEDGVAQTRATW